MKNYETLAAFFIDFDAYFASVEQHFEPSLRGLPVAVVPVMAENSCCIAASYEAKKQGVKTGTRVADAKQICKDITIVPSRPELYVKVHHRVLEVVERHIHVEKVLSIDELWAWLPYNWRNREKLLQVVKGIKSDMMSEFSSALTCSIGLGPNRWLAKMASKMRKPNGFMVIHAEDLPEALYGQALPDLHGVGRNIELRLHAAGIHTVEELCACSQQQIHQIWGGVEGDRFYMQLRGLILPERPTQRRTIGHSHILPPEKRRPVEAETVLHKLAQKACLRLRKYEMLAETLVVNVEYLNGTRWEYEARFYASSDALFFAKLVSDIWSKRNLPHGPVKKLGVTLFRLVDKMNFTPSLFARQDKNREALNDAMDMLQMKFGKNAIHLGCDHDALNHGNMRIAFNHIPDLDIENF